MNCISCHTGEAVHASEGENATHRYAGEAEVKCEDCHQVGGSSETIPQHAIHGDQLSCQVCHSVQYTSCDNCHVSISDKTGAAIFKTDATYLGFYIGLNTRKSADRPYDYVTVRHIPIRPDSYSYYGEDLLPYFDAMPTWAYATPHNIQRVTPQNQKCENCHGNADIFLTADKVAEDELQANQNVIVPQPPAPVGGN
jgi:thiosulfate/3-mercaptopyruvate sulfurtransferase